MKFLFFLLNYLYFKAKISLEQKELELQTLTKNLHAQSLPPTAKKRLMKAIENHEDQLAEIRSKVYQYPTNDEHQNAYSSWSSYKNQFVDQKDNGSIASSLDNYEFVHNPLCKTLF